MGFITLDNAGNWIEKSFEDMDKEDRARRKKRKAKATKKWISICHDGGYLYYIERSRIKTPGQALDWIHQISEKTWAWEDPKIMEDFLEVLFECIPEKWWVGL